MANPFENRNLRLFTVFPVLACLTAVVFLVVADPGSARAPACTEYCYEPIPVPGTEPGDPPQAPGSDGVGAGSGSSPNLPGDRNLSSIEQALGVALGDSLGQDVRGSGGRKSFQRVPGSSTATEPLTGVPLTALAALLLIATLALFFAGIRRAQKGETSRTEVLVKGAALLAGIGLVLLLSPGLAGASTLKAPKSFFGMTSMESLTKEDAIRMETGGVYSYRFPLAWGAVQKDLGQPLDWSFPDEEIGAAVSAGLRVLPKFYGVPQASRNPTRLPIRSSVERLGWANFLRAAVQRYGPAGDFWKENPGLPKRPVRTWQIWNEANFFYFTEPVDPADYLELLKASHRVIKQEDPGAKVMLSGLFGSPPNDPRRSMKSWQFLEKLYKLGAKPYFDSVAIHPYSPNTTQLKLILEKVRTTMNRNGGRRTPIDITEIGWGSDSNTAFGKGSLKAQAAQLTSGYRFLIGNRKTMGIRSAYWFAWKDMPQTADLCNQCYFSGLFYKGPVLKPKPAWDAFVRITGGSRN